MKTFQCLIVDDETLARELIENHISQISGFEVVASCASAIEASQVLKDHHVDLMFLDIEMPVLKGTAFYKNLPNKPKVIFTTAYRDYALDGFELDAVDYLLKPIVFARFFQAIERFQIAHSAQPSHREDLSERSSTHIFVRENRKQVKIELDDILYIQGLKDYVKIYLESGAHVVKQGIGAIEKDLGKDFLRVHRSYVVNRQKITAYSRYDVEIGEIEIPIGDNFREQLHHALKT